MKQYPHSVEIKNEDTVLQYQARLEFSTGNRIMLFEGREVLVKAIVYMPLPIATIKESWSVKVYDNTYIGSTVAGISANSYSFKPSAQVQTDVTILPGNVTFINGTTTVTVPDWIGWNLKIERIGQGTMKKNVDYTWNYLTGVLTLLGPDDKFQPLEWFDVTFEPKLNGTIITDPQTIVDLGNIVLYNGVVKQFSRGQLNARIWV